MSQRRVYPYNVRRTIDFKDGISKLRLKHLCWNNNNNTLHTVWDKLMLLNDYFLFHIHSFKFAK